MSIDFQSFEQHALQNKEALRAKITSVYGEEVATTMIDKFVPFASKTAIDLLGVDMRNPDPELLVYAVQSIALAFTSVLNDYPTLPGKETERISIQVSV